MQDIREYPGGVHSVAPSRYPRAGASKSYYPSSPSSGHVYRDNDDDEDDEHEHEQEASLTGSAQQSSDPDEAVFEAASQHSSPGTSHHSDDDDEMSEFPPDLPIGEAAISEQQQQHFSSSPYTPLKIRSPFRNPSSVRAMQMDTTPPHHLTSSPSSQQRYSVTAASRNGTLRSIRSSHSAVRSPSKLSPTKKLKKEYPLVLLHVTLLPIPIPYSPAVMESVLPHYLLQNWKLLRQKATPTVLDRGILIPHPKEDYDLLEERLLESLELKTPRILKCGHFHLSPEEEADVVGPDSDEDDELADADRCDDCGRRIRDGRFGSGTGSKRWDIKLFAANGLMRAGAWGAAWREMERVDVEIVPWMDEELKRQMELQSLEEAEAEAFLRNSTSQHAYAAATGNPNRAGGAAVRPNPTLSPAPGMDEARMREIYGDNIAQAYVMDELDADDANATTAYPPTTSPLSHHHYQTEQVNQGQQHQAQPPPAERRHQNPEIPLPILLRNYIYLLLSSQDNRNLAIGVLSFLVLLLTLRIATTTSNHTMSSPLPMWKYDEKVDWLQQREKSLSGISDTPSLVQVPTTSGYAPPPMAVSTVSESESTYDTHQPQSTSSIALSSPSPSPSSIYLSTEEAPSAIIKDIHEDQPNNPSSSSSSSII